MMEKITLSELVAMNSTPEARSLVVRNGYAPARNLKDLSMKLNMLIQDQREEGLMKVAAIHPHKDLIAQYVESLQPKRERKSRFDYAEEYIDADGNSSPSAKRTEDATTSKVPSMTEYMPLFALGVVAISALAIVSKSR